MGNVADEELHNKNVNNEQCSELFKTYKFHYVLRFIVCLTEYKRGIFRESFVLFCGKPSLGCCSKTRRRLTRRSSSAVIWLNVRHPLCPHPPYSPDLSPADLFLFPKVKTTLQGRIFQTIKEIQENEIRVLCAFTESAFQEAFQQWKKHLERCIACIGSALKGDSA